MRSGVWIASLNMPSSSIDWPVVIPTRLNIASWTWLWKMSPVLNLVGGIHLIGCRSKICRTSWAWRELEEEAVLEPGVDLEGVAEAHLLLAEAGAPRERLVDELRREHRVAFSTASAVVR